MLWVMVSLDLLTCSAVGFLLWIGYEHLRLLQRLERTLGQWTQPEATSVPLPPPGTMFLVSDAEVAQRERAMRQASRARADVLRARPRPG